MKRYSKKFKNGQFVRTITEDKYNNCRGYIESYNKYNKEYFILINGEEKAFEESELIPAKRIKKPEYLK